jgi:hypothetical protein
MCTNMYDVVMYDVLCQATFAHRTKQHQILASYIFYIVHSTKTSSNTDIVHILHHT